MHCTRTYVRFKISKNLPPNPGPPKPGVEGVVIPLGVEEEAVHWSTMGPLDNSGTGVRGSARLIST